MTDPFRFSPRKKSPTAYFNDGHRSLSVQTDKGKEADALLLEAINAAWKEFNRIWFKQGAAE